MTISSEWPPDEKAAPLSGCNLPYKVAVRDANDDNDADFQLLSFPIYLLNRKRNKNPASLSSSTSFQPTTTLLSEVLLSCAGAPVHFRTILRFALVRWPLLAPAPPAAAA